MKNAVIIAALSALAGCAGFFDGTPREDTPPASGTAGVQGAVPAAARPPATARTVEQFDTTTAADKVAAAQPASGGRDLGTTIATLGAPGEPGFWLKTPLVKVTGPGRVTYPANGKSVKVDLIPLDGVAGAGSRMSLAALRVIEAPLTGLPEVQVFALK